MMHTAVFIHVNILAMIIVTIRYIFNQGQQMQSYPASHSSDNHAHSHTQKSYDQGKYQIFQSYLY